MIRSMTGFGRAREVVDGRDISVEIRAVNHRYFEFSAKLPRSYMYLEDKLKQLIQSKTGRGKIEVALSIYNVAGKETQITVNKPVVENYVSALRAIKDEIDLFDNLSLTDVFRMTDAFNVLKADIDEDEIWCAVSALAEFALGNFIQMRENEGKRIKADLLEKITFIESKIGEVEKLSPETTANYRKRLFDKLTEVLENTQIDEQRVLLEAAVFAEKTAVDEETVRLHSHIAQLREMLDSEDVVGRKLDFLVQEINREINTIGSKAQDLRITKIVVDLKSELEKIREQIQNIE
ncbi:MAG: YicC family protein [Oscillospiraceae bacterium]|nr:YicC family protein [Oscillospiraceae bacterium]